MKNCTEGKCLFNYLFRMGLLFVSFKCGTVMGFEGYNVDVQG